MFVISVCRSHSRVFSFISFSRRKIENPTTLSIKELARICTPSLPRRPIILDLLPFRLAELPTTFT